jgi:hypothetical protein
MISRIQNLVEEHLSEYEQIRLKQSNFLDKLFTDRDFRNNVLETLQDNFIEEFITKEQQKRDEEAANKKRKIRIKKL